MPTGRRPTASFAFAALLACALLGATRAGAVVPVPTVTGPITSPGGAFVTPPTGFDLGDFGYVEEEFFIAGTARGYTASTPLAGNGLWAATPSSATAAFVTRILVRRPTSEARFNGTVIVEWLNVSGGVDAAPDWTFLHPLLKRKGYAWVGVSAQFVGVAGTGGGIGIPLSLKAVNPVRYGPLVHPGDTFSYDMFSQAAEAVRHPRGLAPLGTLQPRRLIAIGESQSAFRMVTYVNAVHPVTHVFDGFLIHSRSGGASPLSESPQRAIPTPNPAFIRTDVDVPVLMFETETDLVTLGYFSARQPDSDNIRTWEVAGTAHDDAYGLAYGPADTGKGALDTSYLAPVTSIFGLIHCDKPVNTGPQHYVESAALVRLDTWIRHRRFRGPQAPRLQVSAGPPVTIARDAVGNALGGIRSPAVDAPILALSGLGQTGSSFCSLFGTTAPLDHAALALRYPTHGRYLSKVNAAVRAAFRGGYLLGIDAGAIRAAAKASTIGN